MEKPSAEEKAYVKKHKLNDMLNDLYISIVKQKPDDPLEFAIRHLESKLPPEKQKKIVAPTPPPLLSPPPEPAVDVGLFGGKNIGQIFNKSNFDNLMQKSASQANLSNTNLNESMRSDANSLGKIFGGKAPLVNFNVVDKINRILIQTSKQLTEDEILKSEEIQVFTRAYEDDVMNDDKKYPITFKKFLNTRSKISENNKNELSKTIQEEHKKLKEITDVQIPVKSDSKIEEIDLHAYEKQSKQVVRSDDQMDEEEKEQLEAELLTRAPVRQKKDDKNKKNVKKQKRAFDDVPVVQLVVCRVCAQVQPDFDVPDSLPQRQQGVIQARTFGQSPAAANHDLANGKRKDSIPEKMDIHPISSSKPPDLKLNTKEAKQDAFDDDNIESASQVSGPRGPIEPFEAQTARSLNRRASMGGGGGGGVMAWVMQRQIDTETKLSRSNRSGQENNSLNISNPRKENDDDESTLKSIILERKETHESQSENQQIWKNLDNSMSDSDTSSKRLAKIGSRKPK